MKTLMGVLVGIAVTCWLLACVVMAAMAPSDSEPCMIDDMKEIIGSRRTVEFSLTTSRITGKAQVIISGPGYSINHDGLPGDWPKLLERAISDWREGAGRTGEVEPEWGQIKALYR